MSPIKQPEKAPMHFTVSIVEDEPVLLQEMTFQLSHMGFDVKPFDSAAAFYRYLAVRPKTIALLDIGLPGEDGLSICQYLRTYDSQMGIVFLTARGQRDDRLNGLSAGADAYLVKPVDMDELVLILKRLELRFKPLATTQLITGGKDLWEMAPSSGWITAPNKVKVRITLTEGQLLNLLLRKKSTVCTHTEIATALGLNPEDYSNHRAEVIVSRLRSKVLREAGMELPVVAVRGYGYRLG